MFVTPGPLNVLSTPKLRAIQPDMVTARDLSINIQICKYFLTEALLQQGRNTSVHQHVREHGVLYVCGAQPMAGWGHAVPGQAAKGAEDTVLRAFESSYVNIEKREIHRGTAQTGEARGLLGTQCHRGVGECPGTSEGDDWVSTKRIVHLKRTWVRFPAPHSHAHTAHTMIGFAFCVFHLSNPS